MADRWSSSGLGLPRQMDSAKEPIGLPMTELYFQALAVDQPLGETDHRQGLWAYMVTLASLFAPLQDLNRKIVDREIGLSDTNIKVQHLHMHFETWIQELPSDVCCSEENLLKHQQQGTGGPFVGLHLGYYHYATLLYFQYLDTRVQQNETTRFYATRCKELASKYSDFLYRSQGLSGCEAVYPTVAHMTVVCSSVLLHTLLFGDEDELPAIRQRLEHNFEMLMKLKRYWPCLDPMVLQRKKNATKNVLD